VTVRATSADAVLLPVSGVWTIRVAVRDADGYLTDDVPVVTVTLPAGSTATPTVEHVGTGDYRVTYVVGTAGRYVARAVTTSSGAADFAAYATATTAGTGMPVVDDVANYLREGAASWTTADLQDALDAESAAQRAVCRVRAVYPADLREALLRRAARNLALRALPLAVHQGDAEGRTLLLPGRDPEVRRLEAPHRRVCVG
jgi:hypothetical protein